MKGMIRLLLVDGNEILREGIIRILSKHAGVELVGATQDGDQVLHLVEEKRPDIVLIGPTMQDARCVQIIRDLRERSVNSHCILLADMETRNGDIIFEAIKARDPEGACTRLRDHIVTVQKIMNSTLA